MKEKKDRQGALNDFLAGGPKFKVTSAQVRFNFLLPLLIMYLF